MLSLYNDHFGNGFEIGYEYHKLHAKKVCVAHQNYSDTYHCFTMHYHTMTSGHVLGWPCMPSLQQG
jgi:hypothetical protein